jgi:hypothetical protein
MSLGKKVLLALLVLLPIAVYAGLRAYVHVNVGSSLKQITEILAPHAAIRFADYSTGFSGSIRLTGVEIQPRGLETPLPATSIDIETPGFMYLLGQAGGDLARSARPEWLRIVVTDVTLDLTGANGGLLDQLANLTARPEAAGIQHCGQHKQIGLGAWRDMGYNRLHLDVTLDYAMDRGKDTARLALSTQIKDVATLSASGALSQVQAQSKSAPWLRGHLSDVSLVYKDQGYLDGLKRYCATASNIGVPEFVDAESGDAGSIFLQQWGIAPGPTLRAAYRDFLARPDTLQLDLAVPPDLKVENIGMYNATDMVDSLSFAVSLNGKRADETQYGFRPPREGPSQAELSARAAVEAMNKPVVRVGKATNAGIVDPPKIVFREIPKEQVHRYVGRQVRFYVVGASVREGLLTSIEGGIAHVQRTQGESQMTLTIALRHVDRVEVQR